MAKAKKRGKASAKLARKKAVKRATMKKAKPKTRRTRGNPPKRTTRKKLPEKIPAATPATAEVAPQLETTIIDVIEEPAPGVVVVTEYETTRTAPLPSSGREPKRGD
jgi:hypothetical protein